MRLSCSGSENKYGGTFQLFHQGEIGELLAKTQEEQQGDKSKGDISFLENINFAELNNPLSPKLAN